MVGGDRKAGLNVIVERASRLVNISLIANKTAHATKVAIVQRLSNHRCSLVKSITYDNTSENVLHQTINEKLGSDSYFARHTIAGRKALLGKLTV